ncbi:MAG: hypothetical protein ACLRSW_00510 [Christensenellaceae bacterium]
MTDDCFPKSGFRVGGHFELLGYCTAITHARIEESIQKRAVSSLFSCRAARSCPGDLTLLPPCLKTPLGAVLLCAGTEWGYVAAF